MALISCVAQSTASARKERGHVFAWAVLFALLGACSGPPQGADGGASDGRVSTMDVSAPDGVSQDGAVPGCTSAAECSDGIDCTDDQCANGACVHPLVPARCTGGTYCDARQGCIRGRVCGADMDCADMDPCTTMERCDPASRTCRFDPLDGDRDGFPPAVCGGGDCDDGNPSVRPGAMEDCNGRDDNCNGRVDEGVMQCTVRRSSSSSICIASSSPTGLCATDCDHVSVCMAIDGRDPMRGLPTPVACMEGRCACPSGGTSCTLSPVLLDALTFPDPDPTRVTGTVCGVDLQSHVLFCGSCSTNCFETVGARAECSGGACRCPASAPTRCALPPGHGRLGATMTCTNLMTDPRNCGACGNSCPGDNCVAGRCTACPAGQELCNGSCVDILASRGNCGGCSMLCGTSDAEAMCVSGMCRCAAGRTACRTASDTACPDLQTDRNHCGACGNVCPAGVACVGGRCSCPAGEQSCGGTCIDVSNDPANCGGCGRRCGCGEGCAAGACTPSPSCSGGTTICGGATVCPFNSNQHCGRCGNACGVGQSCCRGTCV